MSEPRKHWTWENVGWLLAVIVFLGGLSTLLQRFGIYDNAWILGIVLFGMFKVYEYYRDRMRDD